MNQDEPKRFKPKRRRFQFNLKSLLLLPVVVGLLLALFLYWDDWRKHRFPYREDEFEEYFVPFVSFVKDVQADQLFDAYESTSDHFKKQMSRRQFDDLIHAYPPIQGEKFEMTHAEGGVDGHWLAFRVEFQGSAEKVVELWAWVVLDDSFFYRRPPPARVEEMQIREVDSSKPETRRELRPSWR